MTPIDQLLTLWSDWINTNSGSTNPDGVRQMAQCVADRLADLPGSLECIDLPPYEDVSGRTIHVGPALRFRFNPDAPRKVLLSGHLDTVFAQDHPFQSARIVGDHIHGPGATDMKGGILILTEAVRRWLQSPNAARLGGEILLNPDEEIGSIASRQLFTEAAQFNDSAIVFEPALPNGDLVANRKGNGTFRFIAHGRAAHTGRDFLAGRNALLALADLAMAIHRLNDDFDQAIIFNVGNFNCKGPLNVVPDFAELFINVRVTLPEHCQHAHVALDAALIDVQGRHPDIAIQRFGDFTRPPSVLAEHSRPLFTLYNAARADVGLPPCAFGSTGGSSDGNILNALGLPHIDGAGIHGAYIHSDNEFAVISSLEPKIETTFHYLNRLATT